MIDFNSEIIKLAAYLKLEAFGNYQAYCQNDKPLDENIFLILEQQKNIFELQRTNRLIKYSNIPYLKTMDSFELNKKYLPNLNFDEVINLTSCQFIDKKLDVVAIGPPGKGKTHLAIGIAYEAIKRGYTTFYIKASDLLNKLYESRDNKFLTKYLKKLSYYSLLIIDEIGYFDYNRENASLLFQVISGRYEKHSTFFTSNTELSTWNSFINDEKITHAIIDRLAHHSIFLNMTGANSYRVTNSLINKNLKQKK
jgi:DNA replication protein DnaC